MKNLNVAVTLPIPRPGMRLRNVTLRFVGEEVAVDVEWEPVPLLESVPSTSAAAAACATAHEWLSEKLTAWRTAPSN